MQRWEFVYKCVASVNWYPNKIYFGTAEGDFKLFLQPLDDIYNECQSTDTALSKYVWEKKELAQDYAITEMILWRFLYF